MLTDQLLGIEPYRKLIGGKAKEHESVELTQLGWMEGRTFGFGIQAMSEPFKIMLNSKRAKSDKSVVD